MTEFEAYMVARSRLETLWREAERHARLFAAQGDLRADDETAVSRSAGGRA